MSGADSTQPRPQHARKRVPAQGLALGNVLVKGEVLPTLDASQVGNVGPTRPVWPSPSGNMPPAARAHATHRSRSRRSSSSVKGAQLTHILSGGWRHSHSMSSPAPNHEGTSTGVHVAAKTTRTLGVRGNAVRACAPRAMSAVLGQSPGHGLWYDRRNCSTGIDLDASASARVRHVGQQVQHLAVPAPADHECLLRPPTHRARVVHLKRIALSVLRSGSESMREPWCKRARATVRVCVRDARWLGKHAPSRRATAADRLQPPLSLPQSATTA